LEDKFRKKKKLKASKLERMTESNLEVARH
jgi:hypothetical protein